MKEKIVKNGLVQKTDSDLIFDHNKKILPNLIRISSLDEIDKNWEYFFYLDENEIVDDKYRNDSIKRVDKDIESFFKLALNLKKDIVYIPVSTINYYPYPPKLLNSEMKPRIFRTAVFNEDSLDLPVIKDKKKTVHYMILFNIYVQEKTNIEIGKPTYGIMPKFLK